MSSFYEYQVDSSAYHYVWYRYSNKQTSICSTPQLQQLFYVVSIFFYDKLTITVIIIM